MSLKKTVALILGALFVTAVVIGNLDDIEMEGRQVEPTSTPVAEATPTPEPTVQPTPVATPEPTPDTTADLDMVCRTFTLLVILSGDDVMLLALDAIEAQDIVALGQAAVNMDTAEELTGINYETLSRWDASPEFETFRQAAMLYVNYTFGAVEGNWAKVTETGTWLDVSLYDFGAALEQSDILLAEADLFLAKYGDGFCDAAAGVSA